MAVRSVSTRALWPTVRRLAGTRRVHVVGGAVRDRLLGRSTADFDLAVSADPAGLAEAIAQAFGGRSFPLDPERGILRVTIGEIHLDIASEQGGSFEADLERRDFTINAMAVPVADWSRPTWKRAVVDPHGGRTDLRARRVRLVTPRAFTDDPVRLLRAYRIAAELNFSVEPSTARRATRDRARLARSPGERIREEMLRLLATPEAYRVLEEMEKGKLLESVFPDAPALRRTAPRYYGAGGVLRHTLDSVRLFDDIAVGLKSWFPSAHRKIAEHLDAPIGGHPRKAHLKWALLLHDIGKPDTAKVIKGRLRFFEHEHIGADKVLKMAHRFRWSSDETARYARLVRNHMRPGSLAVQPDVSDKAMFRFFRDLGEDAVGMLLVSLADHLTYLTPAERRRRATPHERLTIRMMRRYYHERQRVSPERLLNGHEIMAALGIRPSPLVGMLLTELEEAQSERSVTSREEAISFLKGRWEWHQKQKTTAS